MHNDHLRILILGGYGTFGGRLARLLCGEARLVLFLAGRSAEKARKFASDLNGAADVRPLALDRDGDIKPVFGELELDIVIDASGPFQFEDAHPS